MRAQQRDLTERIERPFRLKGRNGRTSQGSKEGESANDSRELNECPAMQTLPKEFYIQGKGIEAWVSDAACFREAVALREKENPARRGVCERGLVRASRKL